MVSETFIRRHIFDLLPGQTAVVCSTIAGDTKDYCDHRVPLHCTSQRWNYWRNKCLESVLRGQLLSSLHSARGFLRRHGVQVVLGEYLDASLPLFRICRANGIPFFAHAHGHDVARQLRNPYYRKAYLEYREAAGVIAMSQHGKDVLVDLGLDEDSVHVVPHGVDIPAEPRSRPPTGDVTLLAVGRMTAIKAPILLLDSFRRACLENHRLKLLYVGTGELLVAARHFVQAAGLQDRVELLGSQPNEVVKRLLVQADILDNTARLIPTQEMRRVCLSPSSRPWLLPFPWFQRGTPGFQRKSSMVKRVIWSRRAIAPVWRITFWNSPEMPG